MHLYNIIKKTLILLVGLPVLAFLTLALVMPLYFKLTAGRVHADAASVPVSLTSPDPTRWTFAAGEAGRLTRTLVAADNLPGVSIAVGVDGQLVWAGGFGWADVEAQLPITTDTRFRIGTASIALTSAGVGLLVARGKLDLDAPVQHYLPMLARTSAAVTTRQAMAHTAGFRHPHLEGACPRSTPGGGVLEGLSLFADDELEYPPGSAFRYSSYGWILVSAVMESAAAEPFAEFMAREVFTPIGMRGTVPDNNDADMPQRAQLYHPRASADTSTGLEHPDDTDYVCYAGAGMYLSTPSDLVRFGLAMDRHQLLDAQTTDLLQTAVTLPSGESTGYGLGWFVSTVDFGAGQTQLIGHPGVTIGGTATLRRYPEQGIVVAVASNITFAELAPLAAQVAALFATARGLQQKVP